MPLDRERLFRNFIRRLSEKPYMGEEDVIAYERTFHKFLEDRYVTDEFLNSDEFKSSIEDILSSRSKETFWENYFNKIIDKVVELHGLTWGPSPDRTSRVSRSPPRTSPGRARSRSRSPPRTSPGRARSRSRSPPRGSPGRARSRSRSTPSGPPALARTPSVISSETIEELEHKKKLIKERWMKIAEMKHRNRPSFKEPHIPYPNLNPGSERGRANLKTFNLLLKSDEQMFDRILNDENFTLEFINSDLFKIYDELIPHIDTGRAGGRSVLESLLIDFKLAKKIPNYYKKSRPIGHPLKDFLQTEYNPKMPHFSGFELEHPSLRVFWINKLIEQPEINNPKFIREISSDLSRHGAHKFWFQDTLEYIIDKAREFNPLPPAV